MNEEYLRNFLINSHISAYELSNKTSLSQQSARDFIEGNTTPRRKTLDIINKFVEDFNSETEVVKEPNSEYQNISNKDIFNLLEYIGGALIKNNEAVTELLIKTHDNTKELLQITKSINIENLNTLTKKAKSS